MWSPQCGCESSKGRKEKSWPALLQTRKTHKSTSHQVQYSVRFERGMTFGRVVVAPVSEELLTQCLKKEHLLFLV